VREAGGILTMEDLKNYKVDIMDALAANILGYTVYGMPLPSSGTLGLSLVGYIFSLALLYLCQSSISSVKSGINVTVS
jgi:gamma-glutamyltranspeptidase/glutathione hydrolase/leukotriene-C4 hydrolase